MPDDVLRPEHISHVATLPELKELDRWIRLERSKRCRRLRRVFGARALRPRICDRVIKMFVRGELKRVQLKVGGYKTKMGRKLFIG